MPTVDFTDRGELLSGRKQGFLAGKALPAGTEILYIKLLETQLVSSSYFMGLFDATLRPILLIGASSRTLDELTRARKRLIELTRSEGEKRELGVVPKLDRLVAMEQIEKVATLSTAAVNVALWLFKGPDVSHSVDKVGLAELIQKGFAVYICDNSQPYSVALTQAGAAIVEHRTVKANFV